MTMQKRKLTAAVCVLAFFTRPLQAQQLGVDPDALCENASYVVGFFNGVWNTEAQAISATATISRMIEPETVEGDIAYETFYNHTGSSADATAFQDIAEVFIQRAEEIEPDLGENFEIFWSAVSGDADGFLATIGNLLSLDGANATGQLLLGLLSDLYTEVSTQSAALIVDVFSDPPTARDYERHSSRIKTLALQGNRLLLVAHSQGNLFVNNAYGEALTVENYTADSIGVVHIAPASSIVNGPHVLANIDVVINGLRGFGLDTIPSITVDLPVSHLLLDPSGHTLVDTYLNRTLPTFDQVKANAVSEITRLAQPIATGQTGSFTATLTWNGSGDVDLHTFEPAGTQVYYANRQGAVGFLDVDNVIANGPEHYFASCDANVLQDGVYRIGVNNFRGAEGRTAVVQLSTPYVADLATRTLTLGAAEGSAGNSNPDILINVSVSRDSEGRVFISAN